MGNNKNKKYKLIIFVIIIVLISVFIVNKSNFSFVNRIFNDSGKVISLLRPNKETSNIKSKEDIIRIKPETPGVLNLIDKLVKPNQTSLDLNKVIVETNNVRLKHNLTELKKSELLNLSADKKLKDILENQYFEHVSPQGEGIENLVSGVGYEYILIGENLASGSFKDEKSLVEAWMGSFGHRKNILKTNYTELGIAVKKGVLNGQEVWVAVQHFGTPKNVCPKIDSNLYDVTIFNQQQIENLNEDLTRRLFKINTNRGFGGSRSAENLKNIEDYNNLVIYYNKLVDQVKKDITSYNEQVKLFNECVKKYQD